MKYFCTLLKFTWLSLLLIGAASTASLAQSSPSGQAKFVTPAILSACNADTICVEVLNTEGVKGRSYPGNVTLEIDIPGGDLVRYLAGSVFSAPAGVTEVSYVGNKLTVTLPLPGVGATTRVCFVVLPTCGVGDLAQLSRFKGRRPAAVCCRTTRRSTPRW